VPGPVRAALEADFELTADVDGAEGIVPTPVDRVDEALLERAGPALRVVASYSVGLDHVDLEACRRRGVVVANTPDVLTDATAELTLALLLALLRRVAEGDRLLRAGRGWTWSPTFMLGDGLGGRTLLVVGAGRIGRRVGELARAFGMEVEYAGRGDDLHAALARADVVSLHVPLTPETRHLVDAAALAAMKRSAVLVNTARGAVVDEAALVDALARGTIAGAALDVFEEEPRVHPDLVALENVVLAPHLGSATHVAREAMGMLCVDALRAVLLEGRSPANAV
jgi:glyoxylate reductase